MGGQKAEGAANEKGVTVARKHTWYVRGRHKGQQHIGLQR
jgi:hypothetical protein